MSIPSIYNAHKNSLSGKKNRISRSALARLSLPWRPLHWSSVPYRARRLKRILTKTVSIADNITWLQLLNNVWWNDNIVCAKEKKANWWEMLYMKVQTSNDTIICLVLKKAEKWSMTSVNSTIWKLQVKPSQIKEIWKLGKMSLVHQKRCNLCKKNLGPQFQSCQLSNHIQYHYRPEFIESFSKTNLNQGNLWHC